MIDFYFILAFECVLTVCFIESFLIWFFLTQPTWETIEQEYEEE